MESVFVNEVIESAQSYAAGRISLSRIQLVQALDPSLRPVKANRALLRYVFFSMIANAVHHMNGIGVVTIVTGENAEGVVEVTVTTIGSTCLPDGATRTIDAVLSASLKQKGTGLPLPVVRDIIEGQGGTMSWKNDGDGEVKFTVLLPGTCAVEAVTQS
jgi:K+-sensing histidine kinase KdpD